MSGSHEPDVEASNDMNDPDVRATRSKRNGITERANFVMIPFRGDMRKRYTDFIVNEISKDGIEIHLRDFIQHGPPREARARAPATEQAPLGPGGGPTGHPPPPPGGGNARARGRGGRGGRGGRRGQRAGDETSTLATRAPPVVQHVIPLADRNLLGALVGVETTNELIQLDNRPTPTSEGEARARSHVTAPSMGRLGRTAYHAEVRRIFDYRLGTDTNGQGRIIAFQVTPAGRIDLMTRYAAGMMEPNARAEAQAAIPPSPQHQQHQAPRPEAPQPGSQLEAPRQQAPRSRALQSAEAYADIHAPGQGEYLHFTLFKENKDTMDAINLIARMLKIKSTDFGFAGTKDRRAVTVQRVSVRGQSPRNLIWLNSRLHGVRVADFEFSDKPKQLNDHGGNMFHITIKNCQPMGCELLPTKAKVAMLHRIVESSLSNVRKNGFINYFGLQRFGTHTVGTHILGMKILKGKFEEACDDILQVDPHIARQLDHLATAGSPDESTSRSPTHDDELNRVRAIRKWRDTHNMQAALAILPRRFSSEFAVISHLGRENAARDFLGALLSITRGMRSMYLHAYQSYVWNHVATYRWKKYGTKVVVGDLVLQRLEEGWGPAGPFPGSADYDADDFGEENSQMTTHALTQQDLAEHDWTIYDVVLPAPGYDMVYPVNEVGEYYRDFMARPENGELNPRDMLRNHHDFNLPGTYRYLMSRFLEDPEFSIRLYNDDTEQLCPTDFDYVMQRKTDAPNNVDHSAVASSSSTVAPVFDVHSTAPASDVHGTAPASDVHGTAPASDVHGTAPASDVHGGTTGALGVHGTAPASDVHGGTTGALGVHGTAPASDVHSNPAFGLHNNQAIDRETWPIFGAEGEQYMSMLTSAAEDRRRRQAEKPAEAGLRTSSAWVATGTEGAKRARTSGTQSEYPASSQGYYGFAGESSTTNVLHTTIIRPSNPTEDDDPFVDNPRPGHRTFTTEAVENVPDAPEPFMVETSYERHFDMSRHIPRFEFKLRKEASPVKQPEGPPLPPMANGVTTPNFHKLREVPVIPFREDVEYDGDGYRIAVVFKFKLRGGSYATVALREVVGHE